MLNKALLASVSPVTLLVLQLTPSAVVLWASLFIRGRHPSRPLPILPLVLLGLLNPGISYTLGLMGLARSSASVSTLLWAAEPLMILGLGAVFLREPVTRRLLFVMLVGLVGVGLVADAGGGLGGTNSDAIRFLLLLLAVLCCAFYTVFSRKLSARVDALFMVAVQQTVGLGWAFALLLVHTSYSAPFDLGKCRLN